MEIIDGKVYKDIIFAQRLIGDVDMEYAEEPVPTDNNYFNRTINGMSLPSYLDHEAQEIRRKALESIK